MTSYSVPIIRPPWTKLGKKLESMVRKALFDYQMLENCKDVAVALSGGKDSLSLLFMLKAISGRGFPKFTIHAIHVDGEFSCGAGVDKSYLRSVCESLDINFVTCRSKQKQEGIECYRCSRERRSLIFNAAKKIGANVVAFGHHRDDSVQTLLMNLFHKAEFAANLPKVAMYDYGINIIRPLIYVSEKEILSFARQNRFSRIVCQCPVAKNSMRKKVDNLLDEVEGLFPNIRVNIAKAGRVYGSDKANVRS